MGSGTYGIVKPSNLNINDVEVWYQYKPSRNEYSAVFKDFKQLNAKHVLEASTYNDTELNSYGIQPKLYGMYNLKLPLNEFSKKGIYTIYIKPKEIYAKILDSDAILSAYPDVRGIVVKLSDIKNGDSSLFKNNNLIGYRVEYFNNNGEREDNYRLIISNGLVEPINENLSNGNQKSIRYRYNDNSDLIFIIMTPTSATSTRPNILPFIGSVDQTISFTNTNFDPIMLEVEMVENDEDSLATLIFGDQTHNLEDGIITVYDNNHEIVKQSEVYQLKDNYGNKAIYNIRANKGSVIDNTKSWNNIVED